MTAGCRDDPRVFAAVIRNEQNARIVQGDAGRPTLCFAAIEETGDEVVRLSARAPARERHEHRFVVASTKFVRGPSA